MLSVSLNKTFSSFLIYAPSHKLENTYTSYTDTLDWVAIFGLMVGVPEPSLDMGM